MEIKIPMDAVEHVKSWFGKLGRVGKKKKNKSAIFSQSLLQIFFNFLWLILFEFNLQSH